MDGEVVVVAAVPVTSQSARFWVTANASAPSATTSRRTASTTGHRRREASAGVSVMGGHDLHS